MFNNGNHDLLNNAAKMKNARDFKWSQKDCDCHLFHSFHSIWLFNAFAISISSSKIVFFFQIQYLILQHFEQLGIIFEFNRTPKFDLIWLHYWMIHSPCLKIELHFFNTKSRVLKGKFSAFHHVKHVNRFFGTWNYLLVQLNRF